MSCKDDSLRIEIQQMITKDEIQELLHSTETYRVERTTSTGDMDKFQEAICAFANDNGGKNGGDVPNLSQVLSPDEEKDASIDAKDATSSSKVATSDEKVASSGLKDATLKKKISSEEMAIYILEYCSTWRTMDEIAQFANRNKNYIRNKVLPRLAEKLEKEHPDVPNHPRQRYRTIAKD